MAESTKPTEDGNNKDNNTNSAGESSKQGMYQEKDDRTAGYSLKNNKNPSEEQMDQTSTGAFQNVDDQSVSKGAVDERLLGGLTPMKISVMFRTYTEESQNGVNVVMVEEQGTLSLASRNSQKSFKKRGFGDICGTPEHSEDENIIKKIHIYSTPENFNCFESGVPRPVQFADSNGSSEIFHKNILEEILCAFVDGTLQDQLNEFVKLFGDTDDQIKGELPDDDLIFLSSTAETILSSTDSAESIDVDITRPEKTDQLQFYQN